MPSSNKSYTFRTNDSFQDKFYGKRALNVPLPQLDALPKESFNWFIRDGLKELFQEISPVGDLTGKNLELYFTDYYLDEPKYSEEEARRMDTTYEAALRVKLRLVNKETGEIKESEVFLGDIPLMSQAGTFIINGVERVVVSQLVRSSGVLFTRELGGKHGLYGAKIIPERGAWLEVETSRKGVITLKIDRKRKTTVTALLRAYGIGSDQELIDLFSDVDTDPKVSYIKETIAKDPSKSQDSALLEIYKKMRPGDLATVENARSLFESTFTSFRRYNLGRVGRYKLNLRLGVQVPNDTVNRILSKDDVVAIVREVIKLNNNGGAADDVDHLKNRRVRGVGELMCGRFRTGLIRVERIIKDKMSTLEIGSMTPAQLINARPITAIMQEFFGSSQLSQFMEQNNPLSELEHKRRLSAMGQGGLSRERASVEVRDVHTSHYGRICPIQSPEGQSVGLVSYLASYAKVNDYGFIETPYRKILRSVPNDGKSVIGYTIFSDLTDPKTGKLITKGEVKADEKLAKELAKYVTSIPNIAIAAVLTNEVDYLDAYREDPLMIGQSDVQADSDGRILAKQLPARLAGEPSIESIGKISYVDVSPKQILSVGTAMIPFVEHDEAKRALMASNMERQAVPLINPQVPIVGTGMESAAALNSDWLFTAPEEGEITYVDGKKIELKGKSGKKYTFTLTNYLRSNGETCLHQKPIVLPKDMVKKGQPLCDGPAIHNGRLALGNNITVAFMSWEGCNFEDAIVISDRLVREDIFSSVHIKREEIDVRDTKLGPEVTTRDIPNVGEDAVANLDEDGIIQIGSTVKVGDILVGKITPKGETELTAEEKLLRAIFGEKVKDVKDSSLRVPNGGYGKVVDIKIFDNDKGDKLEVGVLKRIYIYIAQMRKVSIGDKLAGRHGNKGVVSKILPAADMPFMEDGTPVDMILNPLGVTSRMNIGQILETHLGWAASQLKINAINPVFEGIDMPGIKEELRAAGLADDGKMQLYNGKTGEPFDQRTTVGVKYMMKLVHMVDDKIHARSIGPYSLITQQPLGGKAQMGGQRLGEMEVWALEGYGAAYTLQEMLTLKSDDITGRIKAYESIIKNEPIEPPHTPEAFNVIVKELQGLCLNIKLLELSDLNKNEIPEDVMIRYRALRASRKHTK